MKKASIAAALCLSLVSATAWAGFGSPLLLSNIEIDLDGTAPVTFVGFATTPGGVPACATQNFQGAVVGSADFVRNVTSVATAAFLAGKKVRVSFALGTGACFQVGGTGAFYPKINGLIIQ